MMPLECTIEAIHWEWVTNFEDVRWEAKKGNSKNCEVLLMRNGTGKTTSILLLQHLVAGIIPDDNLLRRSIYKGLVESKELPAKGGPSKYSVTFKINSKLYTLGYIFQDFIGAPEMFTQTPTGYEKGYKMPSQFKNAFQNNLSLTKLLFLDTQQTGNDELRMGKDAIDGMFKILANVKILEYAREEYLPKAVERERKKSEHKGSAKERKLAETALKRARSTLRDCKTKLGVAKKELGINQKELMDVKLLIQKVKDNTEHKTKYDQYDRRRDVVVAQIKAKTKSLLEALIDPSNLGDGIWGDVKNYYETLSKSRIPKSIAREYLGAILDEEKCICGNAIHETEKQCITQRMESSMGLGILSEVYIMKDKVKESNLSVEIQQLKDDIISLNREMASITDELGRLKLLLGDDERHQLDVLGEKKRGLSDAISNLNDDIIMYESTDDGTIKTNRVAFCGRSMSVKGLPSEKPEFIAECKNIYWLKQIEKGLNKKLAAIAGIDDISEAADLVADVFSRIEEKCLRFYQDKVLETASKELKRFNLLNNLSIHSLQDGITLVPEGGGAPRRGTSTGEELSVIMSVVSALSSLTDLNIPMLIDNPTKGLDRVKINGFEQTMSSLKNQVILFIYNTERDQSPSFFNAENINPSTFMREHESIEGVFPESPPHGHYNVKCDWATFENYMTERGE